MPMAEHIRGRPPGSEGVEAQERPAMQGFPGRRHRQPDRRSDGVGDHFTAAKRSIIPFYKACTRRCGRERAGPTSDERAARVSLAACSHLSQ